VHRWRKIKLQIASDQCCRVHKQRGRWVRPAAESIGRRYMGLPDRVITLPAIKV